MIHTDLCVTPALGWGDSSRTEIPPAMQQPCVVYIQRIKKLSPMTSLELYLCCLPLDRFGLYSRMYVQRTEKLSPINSLELYLSCLPLKRFWIPRDDVSKSEKGLWSSRNCSLHRKLQAALLGDVGFQGMHVWAVCLSLQRVQNWRRVLPEALPREQANSLKNIGWF